MFAKLVLIIVVSGATAAALLVNRQQRIETAHEMSRVHARLVEQRRVLWQLHHEIARQSRPDRVRVVIDRIDEQWTTIPQPAPPAHVGYRFAKGHDHDDEQKAAASKLGG